MSQATVVNTGTEYVIVTGQDYDGVHWNRDAQATAALKPGEAASLLAVNPTRRYLVEFGVAPPI